MRKRGCRKKTGRGPHNMSIEEEKRRKHKKTDRKEDDAYENKEE